MAKTRKPSSPKSPASAVSEAVKVTRHPAKRKNIPPAGLEAQGKVQEAPRVRHHYNPHLPPVLRTSSQPTEADSLPELLQTARQRALTEDEARTLAAALARHEPWLEWSGKREKPWFEVEPVALHIHERVSTQAILKVLARQDVNRDLFGDPQQTYAEAVQFYQHEVDWANRMILGDSLAVMASLSRREDLAGKVQMIYLDPPYGISFKSNFQPQLGQRDVKDKEQDLTREPEMVRAYRDTWTLGIHSYLAYLRDRLVMAKELLADTGSIFVQISDENLHRVRCVMDEVFGAENFVSVISFQTTSGFAESGGLSRMGDYLVWYARSHQKVKINTLYQEQEIAPGLSNAKWLLTEKGEYRGVTAEEVYGEQSIPASARLYNPDNLQSQGAASAPQPFDYEGKQYEPRQNSHWKPSYPDGLKRLAQSGRLHVAEDSIRFRRFAADFAVKARGNIWTDTLTGSFTESKIYVVQTNPKVIERCLLMTTDPGDLVLDPTCGSGTTAYVAEQWGRRWITCDTSRVALALAKQRLLTSRFAYYKLRALNAEDVSRNPQGTWLKNGEAGPRTFECKTVPHITLRSIARNTALDEIFAKHEPVLADKLARLNAALVANSPPPPPRKFSQRRPTRSTSRVPASQAAG